MQAYIQFQFCEDPDTVLEDTARERELYETTLLHLLHEASSGPKMEMVVPNGRSMPHFGYEPSNSERVLGERLCCIGAATGDGVQGGDGPTRGKNVPPGPAAAAADPCTAPARPRPAARRGSARRLPRSSPARHGILRAHKHARGPPAHPRWPPPAPPYRGVSPRSALGWALSDLWVALKWRSQTRQNWRPQPCELSAGLQPAAICVTE